MRHPVPHANSHGPLNEVGYGANLRLLKYCFEGIDRSKFQVCKGDAATVKDDLDYALQTLGLDNSDTIVLCRVPQ